VRTALKGLCVTHQLCGHTMCVWHTKQSGAIHQGHAPLHPPSPKRRTPSSLTEKDRKGGIQPASTTCAPGGRASFSKDPPTPQAQPTGHVEDRPRQCSLLEHAHDGLSDVARTALPQPAAPAHTKSLTLSRPEPVTSECPSDQAEEAQASEDSGPQGCHRRRAPSQATRSEVSRPSRRLEWQRRRERQRRLRHRGPYGGGQRPQKPHAQPRSRGAFPTAQSAERLLHPARLLRIG
jgi:hypothetical protein